ncbi:MAG: CoA ester lyase [Chloroflexi bacterium]|nr:CoA ester lyase [Chloroflexota bacterium]
MSLPPLRSWLYAPGNNAKLLERVFTGGADAVILDLEDAVPAGEKLRARAMVAEAVRAHAGVRGPALFVRVNHPETGLAEADVKAVLGPGLDGLRIPKVESAATVGLVAEWTGGGVPLVCNVESAAGVWNAREIAAATPDVLTLAFGSADFLRDVSGLASPEALETLHARSHVVLAARVAGVRSPVDGVYTRLDDDAGLELTTRQSRTLGFSGRSALHPRQVPIINAVFTPSAAEVAQAREVVAAANAAEATGSGALRLPNGDFVDIAVVRRAEAILELDAALHGIV